MTKPKELKVGDRVAFICNTWGSSELFTPHGTGVVKTIDAERGHIGVRFDEYEHYCTARDTPIPCKRDELRKLPDRKGGA